MSEVNKMSINSFNKGMDTDTRDAALPNDRYRYAENVRVDDGVIRKINGSTISHTLKTLSESSEVIILGKDSARLYIQDIDKTIDSVVVFYLSQESRLVFTIHIIPVDPQYQSFIIFEEEVASELEDRYRRTTVDIDKIGQAGYDVIYFVDNIRPPRKVDLVLRSFILDYVNISLVSLTRRAGVSDIYDVVVRLNVVDGFNSSNLIAARKSFTAYVRAFRTQLGVNHPSVNQLTDRLKNVSILEGQNGANVTFTIYEEDLDTWAFNLFYYKEGDIAFSDFLIGNPESVTVDVGVLPLANLFTARSAQNGSGASTQLLSWDFITSGPIFRYFVDSYPIQIGVTKIYKTNRDNPSNYVANGFHQDWRIGSQNNYIEVNEGVIVDYGINNALVNVEAIPAEYQDEVDAVYTPTIYNRLSEVAITVPDIISTDTLKRVLVGDSFAFTSNSFFYQLSKRDQVNIKAVYKDDVILRVETIESISENTVFTSLDTRRYRYSLEAPLNTSFSISFTQSTSASITGTEEAANSTSEREGGLMSFSSASPGFPVSDSLTDTFTVAANSFVIFRLERFLQISQDIQSATASASVVFDSLTVSGGLTPTKIRIDGVLFDYDLSLLNKNL